MKLSERLAMTPSRTPATVRAEVVVSHRTFPIEIASTLPAGLGPVGFETLRLPTAEAASRGFATLLDVALRGAVPIVALDLETSGLETTSVPFIVALAHHVTPSCVQLVQWSIRNPASERAMLVQVVQTLRGIAERAGAGPLHIVSYNGRSFDLPRLRSRLTRLRVDDHGILDGPHADLVHPARRLFKGRLDDCRLGTLERRVLGVQRHGDLDGREIAELFAELQRLGDRSDPWVDGQLEAARVHNRGDVLSLLALLCAAAERLDRPSDLDEALRAARHFMAQGRWVEAARCLRPIFEGGDEGREAGPTPREAALLLAEVHRRQGQFDAAARWWDWVCRRYPGDREAHDALAKHLEHRVRDPGRALAVAAASSSPCARRLARLRRKTQHAGPSPDPRPV